MLLRVLASICFIGGAVGGAMIGGLPGLIAGTFTGLVWGGLLIAAKEALEYLHRIATVLETKAPAAVAAHDTSAASTGVPSVPLPTQAEIDASVAAMRAAQKPN